MYPCSFPSSSGRISRRLTTQLGLQSNTAWNCNCQNQDILSGPCNLRAVVCFYFPSQNDMTSNHPYFRGYGFDMNHLDYTPGTVEGYTNSTEAGQAAVMNLFQIHPDTAASCGQGAKALKADFAFKL